MEASLEKTTLSYQLNTRPWTKPLNYSEAHVPKIIEAFSALMENGNIGFHSAVNPSEPVKGSPEQDALIFYTLNHAVSAIKSKVHDLEPLGYYLPIVEQYNTQLSMLSVRMFYYLLLICTRESRHERNPLGSSFWLDNRKNYGAIISSFCLGLRGLGSGGAVNKLIGNPPNTTLGDYTAFLQHVFDEGDYSNGYGGPAWGKVAAVLNSFVKGQISAEIMMDTAFTLCHNNGPIFNKGILFSSYSDFIYKILDVQRSGQIPQLFNSQESAISNYKQAMCVFSLCKDVLGVEFSGVVDWIKVESLGSLKKYPKEIANQKQTMKDAKEDYKAKATVVINDLDELFSDFKLEIMPGEFVATTKVKRKVK